MRRFAFFAFLLCSVVCNAQFFIGNPDYVYAKGVARTQTEAENAAMLSLSNTIGAKITNITSYAVMETEGKVSEEFSKTIGIESSFEFGDEVQTYVEGDKRNVTVYKYINVTEYVSRQQNIFKSHIASADSIYKIRAKVKHSKNLVLGHYYYAYCALNTPLMDIHSNNNIEIKEKLLAKIKEIYSKDASYGSLTLMKKADKGYHVKMMGEKTKGLHGFEYLRGDKWETPHYNYYSVIIDNAEGTADIFSSKPTPRCFLVSNSNDIHIRFLYEIEKNGELYRINVPENWYFCDVTIDNAANNIL